MTKTDFRFFIDNILQSDSIYLKLTLKNRVSIYLPESLEPQSNLNTFFPIEMSKNSFGMSKNSRINRF